MNTTVLDPALLAIRRRSPMCAIRSTAAAIVSALILSACGSSSGTSGTVPATLAAIAPAAPNAVPAAAFFNSVTVRITNVSSTAIQLDYGMAAGTWAKQPVWGSIIPPGGQVSYIDGGSSSAVTLAGTLYASPLSGGLLRVTWSWVAFATPLGRVTSEAVHGIQTSWQMLQAQTRAATFSVVITNAPLRGPTLGCSTPGNARTRCVPTYGTNP